MPVPALEFCIHMTCFGMKTLFFPPGCVSFKASTHEMTFKRYDGSLHLDFTPEYSLAWLADSGM